MRLATSLSVDACMASVLRTFGAASLNASTGLYTLPSWMTITCATTGRTSRTGAATVKTGFGANAARAHSVDGTNFGLSVESARTNLAQFSSDFSNAFWTKTTGVTATADTADTTDPNGTNFADKIVYVGGGVAGGNRVNGAIVVPSGNGVKYTATTWFQQLSGSISWIIFLNFAETGAVTTSTTWQRTEVTSTGNGSTNLVYQWAPTSPTNSTFTAYTWGCQVEVGSYPSSLVPTVGATAARAADVLSIPTYTNFATGGFFNVSFTVAPNYSQAEAATDHDWIYHDAANRLYFKQSDQKVYFHFGGATDIVSTAQTFARETGIKVIAEYRKGGRRLRLVNPTTNAVTYDSGVQSAGTSIAFSGPVYVLGNASGAQECADLRAFQVSQP